MLLLVWVCLTEVLRQAELDLEQSLSGADLGVSGEAGYNFNKISIFALVVIQQHYTEKIKLQHFIILG